ncbi:ThuA domain-containing protein [Fulvivirgaceae bacterium BMA10]|uniref:ThuA domain-containing protein n=1 Tax=Splendidivirga corallicola TaxID=3051826 RepID=A0ABT8KNE5_9BACT|nr:ThuA domain-containing protein [Fulvivirgaceae bacterium BMA10]
MIKIKFHIFLFVLICSVGFISFIQINSPAYLENLQEEKSASSVLIIDGVHNHDWITTTKYLREILSKSGKFKVTVSTSPERNAPEGDWEKWNPDFSLYDAIIMNFNGGHLKDSRHWPVTLQKRFERYVDNGGGVVIVHAANNSFPNWPAYNEMIGLGWRNRDFGQGLIINEEDEVVVIPKGEGDNPGHGPDHDFQITVRNIDHPITNGLPGKWLHPYEQLTHGQHGPIGNMTVLSYAWSKDSHKNEPMEWVSHYGKGRIFTTMLGHQWHDQDDINLKCVGFQTMLIRGAEWAATGKVTYPVPDNFPSATTMSTQDIPENK